MWAPAVPQIGKSNRVTHGVDAGMNALRFVDSARNDELPVTEDGTDQQALFSARQSEDQRDDEQDDEYKEQDLGNPDGAGGDTGKSK